MTNPCALSPIPRLQFLNPTTGAPLAGGKLYTYAAGTTTPLAAYTDATGSTPLPNPVILDASGTATVWLNGAYKLVLQDPLSNVIWTVDGILATGVTGAFLPLTGGTLQAAAGPTVLSLNGVGGNQAQVILQQNGVNSALLRTGTQGSGAVGSYDPTGSTITDVITWTNSGIVTLPYQVFIGTNTAQTPVVAINGAPSFNRSLYWQTAGVNRWSIYCGADPESGSNAGSIFGMNAFSDAGAFLGQVFQVVRATQKVTFNQSVTFPDWTIISDRNAKKSIRKISAARANEVLDAVDAFTWVWRSKGGNSLGWIAQDVQKIAPDLVDEDPVTGRLTLRESKMAAFLWTVVKEQKRQIAALEKRLKRAGL